jgi:hypothetical protein
MRRRHVAILASAIGMSAFALTGCVTQSKVSVNTISNTSNRTDTNTGSSNNTMNNVSNSTTANSLPSNTTNSTNSASGSNTANQTSQTSKSTTAKNKSGTPPFAGINVSRSSYPNSAPSAIPDGYQTSGHHTYNPTTYKIIDSWSGKLEGRSFLFDVYKNTTTNQIMVGASYGKHPVIAGTIPSSRIRLSNFTGEYVVFSAQEQNKTAWFAVKLTNGELLPEPKAKKISGCFPCMGGRPDYILGLPHKYPINP